MSQQDPGTQPHWSLQGAIDTLKSMAGDLSVDDILARIADIEKTLRVSALERDFLAKVADMVTAFHKTSPDTVPATAPVAVLVQGTPANGDVVASSDPVASDTVSATSESTDTGQVIA